MVAKVVAPFVDVMGVPHKVGDILSLTEMGAKRYIGFVIEVEVKKSGKRKSSSSPKAKSTNDE